MIAILAGCSKAVPDYAATAKMTKYDNLRAMEYCEVFLIGGNPITKNLKAAVYNTSYLNNQANPLVTCPADLWAKIDPETLKKQYDMLGVFKNGPRMWVNDWIQIPIAQDVTTFDGLQTHWFMTVSLPKDMEVGKKGGTAYKPTIGHRNSVMGFVAGKPVFILDDPDGNTWVMQASAQIVDPNLTYDQLANLGEQAETAARLEVPRQGSRSRSHVEGDQRRCLDRAGRTGKHVRQVFRGSGPDGLLV